MVTCNQKVKAKKLNKSFYLNDMFTGHNYVWLVTWPPAAFDWPHTFLQPGCFC